YEFFQSIRESLQLFQAVTDTTLLHGEGWEFIQIGKYLERADKTSRVLDEDYFLLKMASDAENASLLQWLSVLRSCSARQTYQKIYAAGAHPIKVTELLVLNEHFPRSMRFCMIRVDRSLRELSGVRANEFSNSAEKISGRLLAELSFSSVEDIFNLGLHKAMDDLQVKLNQIGFAIYETYFDQKLPPEPVFAVEQLQPVQQ
ncbi:MAG TPA: alpha-E domain-containing protein, partial [Roseimicrobium sp.]|nr:alpha-E domain-containing protein [Roseimicrobium sp.]